MFILNRTFIHFEGKLVEVYKTVTESRVKDSNGLKDLLECDTVLKQNGKMFFCKTVQEAELIEEPLLEEVPVN